MEAILKNPISYTKKTVQTGQLVEYYRFQNPVWKGVASHFGKHYGSDGVPKPRTPESIMRTRKNIRRLINSNGTMDKFLTLTFAESITDVKSANYEFKIFRQRLEYFLGKKFKYLGVIEFQQNGRVHYHLMMDIPYIPWQKLTEIWGQGRIKIERIRKPNRAGIYMAKTTGYLSKGLADSRLFAKKVFFYSYKTLDKFTTMTDDIGKAFSVLVDKLKDPIYSKAIFVAGRGIIHYELYNLTQ